MAKTLWIVPIMSRASERFESWTMLLACWEDVGSFATTPLTSLPLPTCLEDLAAFWTTTAVAFASAIKENISQN